MSIVPLNNTNISSTLRDAHNYYMNNMVTKDGRPLADPDREDLDMDHNTAERVTFSESVAYVLLRAVWMNGQNDQETFSRVWKWAKANMQRIDLRHIWTHEKGSWVKKPFPEAYRDHLFAWRYIDGLNGAGTPGGIIRYKDDLSEIDRNGINAAADDVEIAAALYLAFLRGWGDNYYSESRSILQDAWDKYVAPVGDEHYFFAGDQFSWSGELNPSYFRPGYFSRIFPMIDNEHPWQELTYTSYEATINSGQVTLGGYEGINLPPSWVAMTPGGDYTDNSTFGEIAGSIFGWDSVRTLWAFAQSSAWYDDPYANSYLTDCSVSPLCLIRDNYIAKGIRVRGLNHDGSRVTERRDIAQTQRLNSTEFALTMYGALLPAYHYAGDAVTTDRIIERINGQYHSGYWGPLNRNDRLPHYFTQNWVALGLMLTNDRFPPGLEPVLQSLPLPITMERAQTQTDMLQIIQSDYGLRTKLNRTDAENRLELTQMQGVLNAIASAGNRPLRDENISEILTKYPQFGRIYQAVKGNQQNLLAYFADFREYWNNAIVLLSVYSQKVIESNDREAITQVIKTCQAFRKQITEQLKAAKEFAPHGYSQTILDLTEAELRAQVINQDYEFYQQGIGLAIDAIGRMMSIDPTKAKPDYYIIAKALLTIGDIYLKLHETEARTKNFPSQDYMRSASRFYNYVSLLETGVEIDAPDDNLYLNITPEITSSALSFNRRMGHLTREAADQSQVAISYLSGVALAKKASLYLRTPGEKGITPILAKIGQLNDALDILEINSQTDKDFFAYYARNAKADLLLSLTDRITFYLFPSNGRDLSAISTLLAELEKRFKVRSAQGRTKQAIIKRLFALKKHIINSAEKIYRATPSKFSFLYASSWIKRVEIAVRQARFMGREFRYLLPFNHHPVFTGKNPAIPDNEFLGIAKNYYEALLLTSTKNKANLKKALSILSVVKFDSQALPLPYPTYFMIHAELKRAEISLMTGRPNDAIKLFKEIDAKIRGLTSDDLTLMAWRPASLRAELYHLWAKALKKTRKRAKAKAMAAHALRMCFESDSEYDFVVRRKIIRGDFKLKKLDRDLMRHYRRYSQ